MRKLLNDWKEKLFVDVWRIVNLYTPIAAWPYGSIIISAPLKVLAQTVVSLSNVDDTYRIRIQQQQLLRSVPTLNQAGSILFYYFRVGF